MLQLMTQFCKLCTSLRTSTTKSLIGVSSLRLNRRCYSIYEPPYINIKPEIEAYEAVWLKLKGNDFAILESHLNYVQSILRSMKVTVSMTLAMPTMHYDLIIYKEAVESAENLVDYSVKLPMYQRVVEMASVPNTTLPVIMEVVQQSLPEGVDMEFMQPNEDDRDFCYIPSRGMETLQQQLDYFTELREERRRKRVDP